MPKKDGTPTLSEQVESLTQMVGMLAQGNPIAASPAPDAPEKVAPTQETRTDLPTFEIREKVANVKDGKVNEQRSHSATVLLAAGRENKPLRNPYVAFIATDREGNISRHDSGAPRRTTLLPAHVVEWLLDHEKDARALVEGARENLG